MTVRGVRQLTEVYVLLRDSGAFHESYFTVFDGRGRTVYDRNLTGSGPPDWWIGVGIDPDAYEPLSGGN